MKITVLGDIHGRKCWKDIVNKENDSDLFIFLGDYVSTHDDISGDEQIEQLKEILQFKEENFDKVILLRGNHDLQHLNYYWAECSGYNRTVGRWFYEKENSEKFLNLTQWIYIDENIKTIFSHAGISSVWVKDTLNNINIHEINSLEPSEKFGFIPTDYYDMTGNSITQSCVWIRVDALIKCMYPKYNQVVGHTQLKHLSNIKNIVNNKEKNFTIDNDLWYCDTLHCNEYLIIIDNEFIPSKL